MITWNNKSLDKKILVDSDVIRHFIHGNKLQKLPLIFPGKLYMLDIVEYELTRSKSIRSDVINILNNGSISRMNFPSGKKIRNEYFYLKSNKFFGDGESACMAVAKYKNNIIASSNLKDIVSFCINNNILYIPTLDILVVALRRSVMTESEIDHFIQDVIASGSKLPNIKISTYIESNPSILKAFGS